MWWIGFRQVKQRGAKGVELINSRAVTCGPYETGGKENQERPRRLPDEWDAAYSPPLEAETLERAEQQVESLTPKRKGRPRAASRAELAGRQQFLEPPCCGNWRVNWQ
jgi:hypothetical protein